MLRTTILTPSSSSQASIWSLAERQREREGVLCVLFVVMCEVVFILGRERRWMALDTWIHGILTCQHSTCVNFCFTFPVVFFCNYFSSCYSLHMRFFLSLFNWFRWLVLPYSPSVFMCHFKQFFSLKNKFCFQFSMQNLLILYKILFFYWLKYS